MSLFDELPHSVSVYGPPTVTTDASGGEVITWPTLRAANVPCLILQGSATETGDFSQSQNQRVLHSIAFSDYDGGIQPGDKLVNDLNGRTYRFTGGRPQQSVGGIQDFNIISVTEFSQSV
jgi:hypothetical protein